MRIRVLQSTYAGAFIAACGLTYVFFLYYTTNSSLHSAETKLEKLTEMNERLSAQQQVVVGHKQRLERSLDEAKEKLLAAKEESEKRYQSLKTAELGRYDALQKLLTGEKALKDELELRVEREVAARTRIEEDSKRAAEQHAIEYQELKQDKEAAIAKLMNDISNANAENKRIQTESTRLQMELEKAEANAKSQQAEAASSAAIITELRRAVALLESEKTVARGAAPVNSTVQVVPAAPRSSAPPTLPAVGPVEPANSVRHPKDHDLPDPGVDANSVATKQDSISKVVPSAPMKPVVLPRDEDGQLIDEEEKNQIAMPTAGQSKDSQLAIEQEKHQLPLPLNIPEAGRGHIPDVENRGALVDTVDEHVVAHAQPDRQAPAPLGLLKRLQDAAAGKAAAEVSTPLAQAIRQKAHEEDMQVNRPPADDDSQARLEGQEREDLMQPLAGAN